MTSLFYLNKYLLKYKWRFILGIIFIIISNVFAIYPAQVIRVAFDVVKDTTIRYRLLNGYAIQPDFYAMMIKAIVVFVVLVLAAALLKGFFLFLTRQTIIVMSRYIEYDLKNEVFCHYEKLDRGFYKRHSTGDLMNRISEDISRVRMYLGPAIMYSINLLVLFVLVITTMLRVNATLTLYVLLPLPLLSFSIYYVSNIINEKSEKVQRQLSVLSTFVQETFAGIRVLKAFNLDNERFLRFENESEKYKTENLRLVKVNALFMPLMILLIGLSTILTIFVGGRLAISGEVSVGNIAEFVIYVNMLTWPVAAMGWVTSITQRAAASQKRINEFLDTKPGITSRNTSEESIEGRIEFEEVSFVYPDSGIRALDHVSFRIDPGKSLGITGRTGSGKSTIANLILRLYDVSEGRILIDGKDIREWNLTVLRRETGYVPQDVFLFSDTVGRNIGFGYDPDKLTGELLAEAAKDAVIYENIRSFKNGMDTLVGERGVTLSGGQKQRISIARALIKKPKILLLDDCLSAVDTETEEKIIANLNRIMKGRTTIIISHRIASIRHCDEILVMDNGRISGKGPHEKLVKENDLYRTLYHQQLTEKQGPEPQ